MILCSAAIKFDREMPECSVVRFEDYYLKNINFTYQLESR